jgi:hypothetical protein
MIDVPVDKKVVYDIFAAKDYSASIYDHVTASLHLNVSAENLNTGVSTPVWDTAFGLKDIRSFPQMDKKWQVEKVFPILQSIEKLTVAYTISYDCSGLPQQVARFETVPKESNSFLMSVDL